MYACVNMGDEVCSSLLQPDAVLARLSMFIQLLPPSPFQEDNPGFDITVVVQTFLPDTSVTDSLKRNQENYVCYFLSSFCLWFWYTCVLRWCPEFSLFIGNVIKYEVYAKLIMNELEKLFKLHIVNTHEWKTGPMNEWLIHNKSCDILWLCLVFIWKRKPSDVERTLLNIHLSIWL